MVHSGDFTKTFIHKCVSNCGTKRGRVMVLICTCVGEHGEWDRVWIEPSLVTMVEGGSRFELPKSHMFILVT